MFRKLILSAVVAVGCVTPFAAAPKAEADVVYYYHHHHHYRVYYRPNCNLPWAFYGRFEHFDSARHAAHHLRHQGFEVEIRS
jgi:hypothetical protein